MSSRKLITEVRSDPRAHLTYDRRSKEQRRSIVRNDSCGDYIRDFVTHILPALLRHEDDEQTSTIFEINLQSVQGCQSGRVVELTKLDPRNITEEAGLLALS